MPLAAQVTQEQRVHREARDRPKHNDRAAPGTGERNILRAVCFHDDDRPGEVGHSKTQESEKENTATKNKPQPELANTNSPRDESDAEDSFQIEGEVHVLFESE